MFRGGWLLKSIFVLAPIAILTIGAVYWFSLQSEYAGERHQSADNASDESAARINACRESSSVFSQITCIAEAVEAQREQNTSDYDLKAQQHMSLWAQGMMVAAFATLAVTAVGVVYVYLTLQETAAGVLVMRREQRPWLHADIGEKIDYKISTGAAGLISPTAMFRIQLSIVNTGNIAATSVAVACRATSWTAAIEKMWGEDITQIKKMRDNIGAVPPNGRHFDHTWVSREVPEPKERYEDVVPAFIIVEITYGSPNYPDGQVFSTIQAFNLLSVIDDGGTDIIQTQDMMDKTAVVNAYATRSHMT